MQQDTQELIEKSYETLKDKQLEVELELEEKKHQYKIQRRSLAWFARIVMVILTIAVSAIISIGIFGDQSYIGIWSVSAAVVCVVLLVILTSYFFWDTQSDGGEEHGFKAIKRFRNLLHLKEAIEELEIQLRLIEKHRIARRMPTEKYKDEVIPRIRQYQQRANGNRRFYYGLQMVIIFCALLVTGLTSGLTGLFPFVAQRPWITPLMSFAVSFLTAMITIFRFRERGYNLQQTADAVEFEISCATRGIFSYKGLSEKETYLKLAEEVERLLNEQRKRQQQLEQASDTSKHGTEGA